MASVREHDLDATREQLRGWFEHVLELGDAEVSPLVVPDGGNVNDTFLFDVTWADVAGDRHTVRRVCRAAPVGYSNLQSNDVVEQAATLQALGTVPDLLIPRVVAVEEDDRWLGRAFFVMEAVSGRPAADIPPYTMTGWLHDGSCEQQRSVYEQAIAAIARVHTVDPFAIGLDHLDRITEGESAVESQLRRFRDFHLWGSDGVEYPVLERAFGWLHAHLPPSVGPTVVNWNDARLGNMLFDGFELRALLDWELIEIGPPEVDLAWFLWHDRFMADCLGTEIAGHPVAKLPGAPTTAEGIEWYSSVSGHQPRDMEWYEMFAAYRMGVYLMRHGKGLIATGQAEPDSGVDHVNVASLELGRMLGGFPVTAPPCP